MSLDLVWLNGEYVPVSQALVSVYDRGLAYGEGAFTTLRVGSGEPLLLQRHLERLGHDLRVLHLPPPNMRELESACRGLIERLGLSDAVLKITVTGGTGGRGPAPPERPQPNAFIIASSLTPSRSPIIAVTAPDERGPLSRYKSLDYLANVLALREARIHGYEEAILTRHGVLAEATVSNLVGLEDDALRTPARNVLPGIARAILLESGKVGEGEIPLDTRGPLYCVNAVRGVEAVAALDGRELARDAEIESRLTAALRQGGALPPAG